MKWDLAALQFETFGKDMPTASKEEWAAEIQAVWRGMLTQDKTLSAKRINEVLAIKTARGRAFRLVYMASGRMDEPEDFRRQLARVNPKLWP